MKRSLSRIAIGALLVLGLGACSKPGEDRREVVSVWSTVPAPSMAPWVARFEEGSPRVRVAVRTFAEEGFADSLASALVAGKAPDLATIPSEAMPALMDQAVLSDWSAGVADLRDSLRGWGLCMQGDAIYGLPWLLDTRVLYYNVARWRAAGGADGGPRDAAALQHVAAHTHGALGLALSGGRGAFAAFAPWAYAAGAEVGTASLDSARIASEASARTLAALIALRHGARLASQDTLEEDFAAGRLTLLVAGADLAARLETEASGMAGNVPVPSFVPGERSRALVRGTVLASFTSSRHKEDALRFARLLVAREPLATLARTLDGPAPALASADSTEWARVTPLRHTLALALDSARALPVHPAWPTLEAGLDSLFALAFAGHLPVAQTLAAADTLLVTHARPR